MNCTDIEFRDKIFNDPNHKPHTSCFCQDVGYPDYLFGVIGVMKSTFDAQTSLNSKISSSCWVWYNGTVIKDTTGLFIPINIYTATYTPHVPHSVAVVNTTSSPITIRLPNPSDYSFEIHKENQINKCECGASAVNSSQHSSWCDMSSLEVS